MPFCTLHFAFCGTEICGMYNVVECGSKSKGNEKAIKVHFCTVLLKYTSMLIVH